MRDLGQVGSTASLNAMLGAGSVFEGKLHFEGQVRIDGTFTGEITTTDLLVIGDGAKVSATINCGSVEIRGNITGSISASESSSECSAWLARPEKSSRISAIPENNKIKLTTNSA